MGVCLRPNRARRRGGFPWHVSPPATVRSPAPRRRARRGRAPGIAAAAQPSTRAASRSSCASCSCPGGARAPEGAEGRQGPSRVPADLLGAARPDARARRPTSSRTRSARSGSRPTSSSRTRTRRAPRPAAGRCWRCSAGRRRSGRHSHRACGSTSRRPLPRAPGRRSTTWPTCARARPRAGDLGLPRPARSPVHFTGAELRIAFDAECRFAEGGILAQDLRRAAAARGHRPDLAYRRGSDGRLVPLAAQRGRGGGRPRSSDDAAGRLPARRRDEARHARAEGRGARGRPRPLPSPGGRWAAPGGVSLAVRAADATRADRGERGAGQPRRPGRRRLAPWRPGACR